MRARLDLFTAFMGVVPSHPVDTNSIRKISKRVTAPTDRGAAWLRELRPGGGFARENRNSLSSRWREEVFLRREAGRRCGGGGSLSPGPPRAGGRPLLLGLHHRAN